MNEREISNLDLKLKLTNEYLRNGGIEKIFDTGLLDDITKVKFDHIGKANAETVSSRVNAFMNALLGSHLMPPFYSKEQLSEYVSTLQKSNSFEQENIDTIEQFDKIYEEFKSRVKILFRGQREAKWRLYSKLQRHWILERLWETQNSYQVLIEKIVSNGRNDFGIQLNKILAENDIDSENDISVLGYLQHHGCPTPLLDWTYKFQNALYFGIDGLLKNNSNLEIDDYFSVYFIEEKHLESGSMRTLLVNSLSEVGNELKIDLIATIAKNDSEEKEMKEHFENRQFFDKKRFHSSGIVKHMTKIEIMINIPITYFSDKDVDSGIIFSLNNSKNILNQAGVFTWNSNPTKPLEMAGNEQYDEAREDGEPTDYRFCNCLNINKALVDHIRYRLNQDGIDHDFIYPTADVDASYIFEKSKIHL